MASIYCHIPFCARKCVYCDFYSIEDPSHRREFCDALALEIRLRQQALRGDEISTIYLGGGTPSLLTPDEIGAILHGLRENHRIAPDAEITLEANPGTIDPVSLAAFRELGINRLSIGVQSFQDDELRFLGRIHTADDACRAVEDGRSAGFDNISLDLIFSLPGQTPRGWEETLRKAIALRPEHLSAYSLIVEEQTPLHRMVEEGRVVPNREEVEADLYERTMAVTAEAGFEQYEVSSYAKDGFRCRHNIAYWTHANYLGLGPSAHSFVLGSDGAGSRWWNVRSVERYCSELGARRLPVEQEEGVDPQGLARERIFLGLRSQGIRLQRTGSGVGFAPDQRQRSEMSACLAEGLALEDHGVFKLTPRGYLLCDEIAARLLP